MSVYKELKSKLKGKIVFVGVGNTLRGDDGAGIVAVNMLKEKFRDKAAFFDCATSPENYLEKFRKFNCVVIFDAVEFGAKSGEIAVFDLNQLSGMSLSTHNLSLKLLSRYFEKDDIDIILIGVQPKNLNFGEELSEEVRLSLDEFVREFPSFN